MKKIIISVFVMIAAGIVFPGWVYSQEAGGVPVLLVIEGVQEGKGIVYVGIYSSESSYKNRERGKPDISLTLEASETVVSTELTLPAGDYVVSVFQDLNGNGELESGLFGIPSEPTAKTNYNNHGVPPGWNKLKIAVNAGAGTISLRLGKVWPL